MIKPHKQMQELVLGSAGVAALKRLEALNEAIGTAIAWTLDSGIQETSPETRKLGGVYSWYDLDEHSYPFVYTEITGYYVTYMLYLYERIGNRAYLERAKLAADYLAKVALDPDGGYQCRMTTHEELWNPERKCTFDAGVILIGLTLLAKHDEKYKELAIQTGNWLVDEMLDEHGRFFARKIKHKRYDTPTRWSEQSGSFHCKLVIGLHNLYLLTNDHRYEAAVRRIADWTLSIQERDGRFITNRGQGDTYIHAHCYSTEGLFAAGELLHDERYLEAAKRAVNWLFNLQNPDGSLPSIYHHVSLSNTEEKTEMMAQAIRLRLLANELDGKPFEQDHQLHDAMEKLLSFQYHSTDKQNGGFYYGIRDDKTVFPYVNSWSTMFAVQAMLLYREKLVTGKLSLSMREYV